MPTKPFVPHSNTIQALSDSKDGTRFSIIFLLLYLVIAMHYFDLPTIHVFGNIDLKLEVLLFFMLFTFACMTFLAFRLAFTNDIFLIGFLPLLAFVYAISGIFISGNNIFRAFFEFQPLLYYLSALFPVIFIRRISEAKFILKWMILLTIIFLPFVLLQYVLMPYNYSFIPGKAVTGFMEKGFVRYNPISYPILLFVFFYAFWKILIKPTMLDTVIFAAFLLALILPLSRNIWVSMILGVMVITSIAKKEFLRKLPIMLLFIMLGLSALAIFMLETSYGQIVLKRAGMISIEAIRTDSSLRWRAYETRMAIKAIFDTPFWGHGLGYKYHNSPQFSSSQYYIHNSYLFLWMKMGIPGIMAFATFLISTLKTSLYVYNTYRDDHLICGAAIAMFAYVFAVIPALVVAPFFTNNMTFIILISVFYGILIKLKALSNAPETLRSQE